MYMYELSICATVKSVKLPIGDATSLDASINQGRKERNLMFTFSSFSTINILHSFISDSHVKRHSRTKENRKREEAGREV
jgi:hypothetical protein